MIVVGRLCEVQNACNSYTNSAWRFVGFRRAKETRLTDRS